MSGLALAVRQFKYENKAFWRNPPAAFFTVVFPLIFLVVFNLLFGNGEVQTDVGKVSGSTFYVASIAALSVISACYVNVSMGISFSRDAGTLKRLRGTPLPAWAYIFGRVAQGVFVAVLLVGVVTFFGALFYDVSVPTKTMPAFIVTTLVGAATFSALGLAITSVIPNAEASPAVVNASILPLEFISGIFIPLDNAPDWLPKVADLFPVKHFADAMRTAFSPLTTGSGFEWDRLGVVALWGIAGAILAARYFSWEPRR